MTITTRYQQIRHGSRLAIAIGVVGCALVAPAGAAAVADYPVSSAVPEAGGEPTFSSVTALSPPSSEAASPAFSSLTSVSPPSSEPSGPAPSAGSDYSTLSSITGHEGVGQAPVSVSAASASDGFDWTDAAIGAGIASLLALCASGVALVGRRRHTLSPTV